MDDLFDLDFASAGKSQPPQPATQNPQARYGGRRSAFDYLAASGQLSAPPARVSTPQQARALTPKAQASGGDAFSSLFGTSSASTVGGTNGLSMAERLHKESAAKFGGYGGANGLAAGISSFGRSSPVSAGGSASRSGTPALQPSMRVASPSSSLNPTSRTASPAAQSAAKSPDPWDFDLLSTAVPAKPASLAPAASSAPAVHLSTPSAQADEPFDLGFDSLPATSSSSTASAPATSPGGDDFDLLDAFAAPAVFLPPRSSPLPTPSPAPTSQPPSTARLASDSPPPHVLGHLVEMGFSPSSASAALSATRGPAGDWDIDAAVDALAKEHKAWEASQRRQKEVDEWGDEDNVRVGRRRSWEFDDDQRGEAEARRRRAQQVEQEERPRQRTAKPDEAQANGRDPGDSSRAQQDAAAAAREQAKVLQEQATEMLAQAQKIGFSMFKSANAYWGEGKKVLQKKIEEQRSAMKAAPGADRADGRPRWWKEGMDEDRVEASADGREAGRAREKAPTFKDSDDEGERPDPVLGQRPRQLQQQASLRRPEPAAPATTEYRSPFRRAKPAAAPPPPAEGDLLFSDGTAAAVPPIAAPRSTPRRPRSTPSPAPRQPAVSRPHIAVSPSSLTSASRHKTTGNEHFKLGRFSDASAAYSLALDSLPDGWLGRVPLLNNRAQARLRSGEEKAAATDCTEAFGILVAVTSGEIDLSSLDMESSSLPAEVTQLHAGGAAVDLKDQLGKALGRRAKALEADEKWRKAREDWETILKLSDESVTRGAGGVKMVSDSVARCKKMLDGPSAPSNTPPTVRPSPIPAARPKSRSPAPPIVGSGEAVKALQAQQAAAAAEDDQRLELKDQVDARIAAWKGGKETNLRALIASLDTVLWPELGWKTVGMHELISDNQLKVRYVRAISKVHPDKLNASNTTLEQRMIAALVFAALNDAWNGMK
ncbi:ER organization and biogenesis-related protein [Rhodotorula toruloides]|uniref:ER organization and biogenesis-related protein n=1 Tax=Rhodotorula toruloides TaxID=5286 RepID=A0A511KFZ8_RHOTO|nr:ER organization and biogenesis-related protein [Rhodotorula toruloides]